MYMYIVHMTTMYMYHNIIAINLWWVQIFGCCDIQDRVNFFNFRVCGSHTIHMCTCVSDRENIVS